MISLSLSLFLLGTTITINTTNNPNEQKWWKSAYPDFILYVHHEFKYLKYIKLVKIQTIAEPHIYKYVIWHHVHFKPLLKHQQQQKLKKKKKKRNQ